MRLRGVRNEVREASVRSESFLLASVLLEQSHWHSTARRDETMRSMRNDDDGQRHADRKVLL